ncbi:MAG: HPr(Ser) kinase/phosphatase [Ruminococcaceae bacterium]|nr:HPr(Ser) kinase/phosphatase [Oscillospiraceae bacterium]MBQ4048884.1 HPr(Ser) kinase/phosphatase [Clostridia bacterium]
MERTTKYPVSLGTLIDEFSFIVENAPEGYRDVLVYADDINRCGLQLAGFYDFFDSERLQMIGKVETTFLSRFTPERRRSTFERLFETHIPALIITRDIQPFEECMEMARKYNVPILRTKEDTSSTMGSLLASLKLHLAPRVTLHGVLIEVYGEGILILGDSGVGKSETAIELVKRGHRLIADDAVEIKRASSKTLVGSAPDIIRHFIELRGIGIVDVRRLFGMAAVKMTERVDLIINLELWKEGKIYDRLGEDTEYTDILGLKIPSLTVPVKPGRNLAVIIEVAAMNDRNKRMGYNAAQELTERLNEAMGLK